jgi:signal transduction histidine kinase
MSNTTPKKNFKGFAVIASSDGGIRRVVKDEHGFFDGREAPRSLTAIIDAHNIRRYLSFLNELAAHKAVFEQEINVRFEDAVETYYFTGGVINEDHDLLIVGSQSPSEAGIFYDELMKVNNEQMNIIRSAVKDKSLSERMYEDMSRLNNELVSLQRDLQKKNIELERMNEQKNYFIGIAAHDLRNPLGSVRNLCELLIEGDFGSLNDTQIELLGKVRDSSSFMLSMVEDLLDITRIEAGKLDLKIRSQDLISFARGIIEINRFSAEKKKMEINFKPDTDHLVLEFDPGKIEQVLNNLITNAVKYAGEGSPIDVVIQSAPKSALMPEPEISSDFVLLAVKDRGPGIPEEEQNLLFQPFGRTSVQTSGGEKSIGLGLMICRKIIVGHGGVIWVESAPGMGSSFYFTLPRNRPGSAGENPRRLSGREEM